MHEKSSVLILEKIGDTAKHATVAERTNNHGYVTLSLINSIVANELGALTTTSNSLYTYFSLLQLRHETMRASRELTQ